MTMTTNDTRPDPIAQARDWLSDLFAPWVQALRLAPVSVGPDAVVLRLPFDESLCRVGGTLCGQALMSAADTAMVLAVMTQLGEFRPMTTVQLQTSFLRPIPGDGGTARVVARVLRMGRKLVFGEIEISDARGELAAHATTTYALV